MLSQLNFCFVILITILKASMVLAHGEDKFGPNGGFIFMPGVFHTEVVPTGSDKLKVFLLDIEWKNPTTKNSSVSAEIKAIKTTSLLKCETKEIYFLCSLPKGSNLNSGQLEVLAMREGQKGNLAIYDLPLKLQKKGNLKEEHHGHHH
jgi:hypothetical protein